MKRLEILPYLALLLLTIDSYEASLLARGRTKTKKIQDQTKEAPYVCLDAPANLPACNFGADAESETLRKPSRQSRSLDTLKEADELSPIGESEVTQVQALTIIYKIEGCIPSRLPFVLPLCKKEDSDGRTVEVRRLFPFKVTGSWSQKSGVLPTLVFPEVEMNQWHRFMQGPWIRPADNDDNPAQSDKVTRQISEEEQTESTKTTKRKKAEQSSINEKKNIPQSFADGLTPREVDENDIFSKFAWPTAVEQLVNDRARDTDSSYKKRSSRFNRIVDASQEDGEIGVQVDQKAFSSHQQRHEFPYAKAIPYDPEKLQVAKLGSEFPYARAIPYDPENLRVVRIGSEFPYNRAISYDSRKLRVAGVKTEQDRPLPYVPEKLRVASIGSEFPYSRAIAFDPKKLQVAKRGSEFPYTRAIPYDAKKLEARRSAALGSPPLFSRSLKIDDDQTKPKVVPFDSSMLDAAKEGGVFPYGKGIPDDTSRIVDTAEFPRSSAPEKIQVPVRHVKTFWNEEFATYGREVASRKEEMKLENARRGRELEENLIDSWNGVEASGNREKFNGHARVTRRAIGDGSGDSSSGSDSLEIPKRWSEFPYSKAIPFDPEKLRRPRSSVEYYRNTSLAIPRDFPYAKAIPYDPWKLASFRRKKSKDAGTTHD